MKLSGYGVEVGGALVAADFGSSCVKGSIGPSGGVTTEVSGRTADGPCLPEDGGH